MIISTHTITEEYCEGTLVIADLETDRGCTTFSTVSAVEEIGLRVGYGASEAVRGRDAHQCFHGHAVAKVVGDSFFFLFLKCTNYCSVDVQR